MNGHYNIWSFEFFRDAIATYCLYILSLIHSRAYDTDLGLKSGRVRQLNCCLPIFPNSLELKSDACWEQGPTIDIWLHCSGVAYYCTSQEVDIVQRTYGFKQ